MITVPVQERTTTTSTNSLIRNSRKDGVRTYIRSHLYKHVVLVICTAVLLFGSVVVSLEQQAAVHAANPGPGNGCSWYTVRWGDTLNRIAGSYRSNIWTLAQVNYIKNVMNPRIND